MVGHVFRNLFACIEQPAVVFRKQAKFPEVSYARRQLNEASSHISIQVYMYKNIHHFKIQLILLRQHYFLARFIIFYFAQFIFFADLIMSIDVFRKDIRFFKPFQRSLSRSAISPFDTSATKLQKSNSLVMSVCI